MDVNTLLALAQNAVDVGNIKAGCEFFEVALQMSPNNVNVLEAYAEIMVHYVQDANRARQMLTHAINVDPDVGYVKYLNLAQLCEGQEALDCYKRAYMVAQQELAKERKKKLKAALQETLSSICVAGAELYLTDLCFEPNAEEECEKAVTLALKHNPRSVEAHQSLASLRLSQQRPEDALDALRTAVDLTHVLGEAHQPTYESKVELGKLLMQVSADDAFHFLLEVLQMGDNNAYVWFLLGESARMRKRFVDAARLLRRARVMLVAEGVDADGVAEVDRAIAVLVEEMGGVEAANKVPDLDHPNPIELLEPEEDEDDDDEGENEAEPQSGAQRRRGQSVKDSNADVAEEPDAGWRECEEEETA